jgi:hypothetical protein
VGPGSVLSTQRNVAITSDTGVLALSDGIGFIDYFLQPDDLNTVMNEEWLFRYRLTNYVILDGVPIYSAPSGWTDWVRPGAPPIATSLTVSMTPSALIRSKVQFRCQRSATSIRRARIQDTGYTTYFGIQIRRQAPSNIIGNTEPAFFDVGVPLYVDSALFSGDPSAIPVIEDPALDRAAPDTTDTYTYYIYVQEFLVFGDSNGQVKELIRKQDSYQPQQITLQARTDDSEWLVTAILTID